MVAEASRRRIRVFLSSPGDVVAHRVRAGQIVLKLAREFSYHFDVEPVLWERQPLRATGHFQDEIIPPRQTDITVVVLWGKLGTPLPEDQFTGAVSGRKPVTGTEWEFEDAFAGYQARKRPHLLVYRCLDRIPVDLNDEDAVVRGQAGKRQIEEFMRRWFLNDSDQTLKAAFHPFITLTEFEEKLESNLRDLLRQEAGNAMGEVTGIRWHESPYRGLGIFDVQHAPIFFGRTRARNELLQCLSQRIAAGTACVLVLGASGSGKSSLVRAGMIPDLLAGEVIPHLGLCRYALLKPSDAANPVAALAESLFRLHALPELAGLSYTGSSLADLLDQAPAQAVLPIRQGLEQAARNEALADHAIARLVIVVDQLEELFTLDSIGAAQREHFARVLDALARSGLVWVIATLRSDFFDRLETLPQLAQLTDGGRYLVLPPDAAELGQIIRQPAREGGVRFERSEQAGISLDDRILVQAQKSPGALPLLEFLLDELWKQRTDNGLLTFAALDSLGGLEGAIGRRAEEEFQLLPAEVQRAFPEVLRELVTVGEEGIATSRPAAMSRFTSGTPQREAVDAFLRPETRLLVAHSDDQSRPQVRLTHEALLTHWDRARTQIERDKADLQTRARVETAAKRWRATNEGEGVSPPQGMQLTQVLPMYFLLSPGVQLAEATDLLGRRANMLDASTRTYIELSAEVNAARRVARQEKDRREVEEKAQMERRLHEEEQRRLVEHAASAHRIKRRTQMAAILLAMVACVAIGAGVKASRSQTLAESREQDIRHRSALAQFAEAGRQLEEGHTDSALARLAASLRLRPDDRSAQLSALRLLHDSFWVIPATPRFQHRRYVNSVQVSPDGTRLVTASDDTTAQVWNLDTGSAATPPLKHASAVLFATFSSDGSRVATATRDGTIRVWNASSGAALAEPFAHLDTVLHLAFSPKGDTLASASKDGSARLWNTTTGDALSVPLSHEGEVWRVGFSRDGAFLVTASKDHTAKVWAIGPNEVRVKATLRHGAEVWSAEFSNDGTQILTASSDHTAQVWDWQTGMPAAAPLKHDDRVVAARFGPDGKRVVTASFDMTARIWEAATSASIGQAMRHGDRVVDVDFSSDGARVVTASWDNSARIWDGATGAALSTPIRHLTPVAMARFYNGGRQVVTASADFTARAWRIVDSTRRKTLAHQDGIGAATYSPDGESIVSGSRDGSARIWNSRTAKSTMPQLQHLGAVLSVDVSSNGRFVVTASQDSTAKLWDLHTGQALGSSMSHSAAVAAARFSPDGKRIVTASMDGTARLWSVPAASPTGVVLHHGKAVYDSAFSPDGQRVVTASADETARIWNANTGEALVPPLRHGGFGIVLKALFSPNGMVLATASSDRAVRLWNVKTGVEAPGPLIHRETVQSVHFSADGRFLASASSDRSARIWMTSTGAPTSSEIIHGDTVWSARFSPDGQLVATASKDGLARILDARSGTLIGEPIQHGVNVWSVAFRPDGGQLLSTDDRGRGILTDLPSLPSDDLPCLPQTLEAIVGLQVNGFDSIVPVPDHDELMTSVRESLKTSCGGGALVDIPVIRAIQSPTHVP